jgi:hypothetical protein
MARPASVRSFFRIASLGDALAGGGALLISTTLPYLSRPVAMDTPEVGQPLSREAVWARVVHIISDQMQIDVPEIVPEARITQDLGID